MIFSVREGFLAIIEGVKVISPSRYLREKGLSLDILVLREAGLTFVIFMEEELSLNTIERRGVSSRYIE